MNKPIKIRLHVLSPIHIGCDDVYEPTSFVIDENKKKLIEFDPIKFVKALNDKQRIEFLKVCSGDNLLAIMKFIKTYGINLKGKEVDIAEELIIHYKKVLGMSSFDKKAVINQFTMNKTAYNPQSNMPYIPGTSLKGSMRTAYLSALAAVKQIKGYKGKSKDLETQLLGGDFATDPFRMVKVSDLLPVGNVKTKIVYAVNKKKKKSDMSLLSEKGGAYQIFETIQRDSVFEGVINIQQPEQTAGISDPVKDKNLLLSAHRFYAGNLKQEITPLNEALGIKHKVGMAANTQFKDRFKEDVFLIRLGRHSGAEAVTIEGNRNIKIMQGKDKKPKYDDQATTLWLASEEPRPTNNNGLLPFGWAALEVID